MRAIFALIGVGAVTAAWLLACAAGNKGDFEETTPNGGSGGAGTGAAGAGAMGGGGQGGGANGGSGGSSSGSAGAGGVQQGGAGQGGAGGSVGGGGSGGATPCYKCSEWQNACSPCPDDSEICSGFSGIVFDGWRDCVCGECATECELTCTGSGQDLTPDCDNCIDAASSGNCTAQLSACFGDN